MPRSKYRGLIGAVPKDMLDGYTSSLLDWFGVYFQKYPESEKVEPEALLTLMRLSANLDPAQMAVTSEIVNQLNRKIPDAIIAQTQNQLEELAFAGKAGALLSAYNTGQDIDLTFELNRLAQETRKRIDVSAGAKWADGDVCQYIIQDADNSGFQFRVFPSLHQRLRGLRGGHNICISAPTDKGKTSLLMKIAVDFAMQSRELEPERPLLYMVNEGTAEALTPRVYQTALGCTRAELYDLAVAGGGELMKRYLKEVPRADSVRLVNIHGMNTAQVCRIIDAHEPYCVISDMTGRIRSASNNVGANDTSQLEEAWNTLRELAAMQDFIHIGTTQVSAEGMNQLFPPLTAMQNSKVGIQTTLDLCLMMGALDAPEMADLRGLSTPKNKLARTGCSNTNQIQAIFQAETNTWS